MKKTSLLLISLLVISCGDSQPAMQIADSYTLESVTTHSTSAPLCDGALPDSITITQSDSEITLTGSGLTMNGWVNSDGDLFFEGESIICTGNAVSAFFSMLCTIATVEFDCNVQYWRS